MHDQSESRDFQLLNQNESDLVSVRWQDIAATCGPGLAGVLAYAVTKSSVIAAGVAALGTAGVTLGVGLENGIRQTFARVTGGNTLAAILTAAVVEPNLRHSLPTALGVVFGASASGAALTVAGFVAALPFAMRDIIAHQSDDEDEVRYITGYTGPGADI